jgi:hypothetical protein
MTLAERGRDHHLMVVEIRPNDLALPRTARLTDDLPSKNLERAGCDTARLASIRI